ncbi:hypothetical protein N9N28_14725 [Rubripirellula amarantea]|nr:hypothetical protein [Rubripirellula amarantea]
MHISDLSNMLLSDDVAQRRQAAELLSQNADVAVDVAVELVRHVGDADRQVAEYCVATLEDLGEPAASQLEALSELATNENADVAYWALTLMGRGGITAAEHAMLLGDIVASEAEPAVRERAAWAIARIGPAAAVAQPQLESCQDAEPESLARAVAKALEAVEKSV